MGKPLLSLAFLLVLPAAAGAQETTPGDVEGEPPAEEGAPAEAAPAEGAPAAPAEGEEIEPALKQRKVRWGVGARVRYVFMPTSVLNLFVDQSQPMSSVGFGLQGIRRKGNFDVIFGFEYENIEADEGLWTENGGAPNGGDTDRVTFDGFALLGFDVGFVWHYDFHPRVALRYGGGIGIGFLLGDYIQTDQVCAESRPPAINCSPAGTAPVVNDSKPPVVPIVNALIGAKFKATDEVSINLEGGFRDVFFIGIGSDYVF